MIKLFFTSTTARSHIKTFLEGNLDGSKPEAVENNKKDVPNTPISDETAQEKGLKAKGEVARIQSAEAIWKKFDNNQIIGKYIEGNNGPSKNNQDAVMQISGELAKNGINPEDIEIYDPGRDRVGISTKGSHIGYILYRGGDIEKINIQDGSRSFIN